MSNHDIMSNHDLLVPTLRFHMRSIHSAEDVKDLIENETNLTYDIKVHTADQIQAVRDSLPSLGPLTRAMKIHEIYITADGVVKSKNLPTDMKTGKKRSVG